MNCFVVETSSSLQQCRRLTCKSDKGETLEEASVAKTEELIFTNLFFKRYALRTKVVEFVSTHGKAAKLSDEIRTNAAWTNHRF